ncbi:S9 family peptidase [Aspergillus homomorphus CBS 101889]|uniref:Dipeptidyl-peptidase V n=1 Tax=Aspergillus homomorphus (strain CBS 101889) TaxID=1450537 RepID=A0A395IAS0_ASPHC|nr:alpha/beta-hydrolase [Aspergillus homomorphus CBS 101889]RAL17312.1 alpha/beta-hydrolase [Aspergillus homomorphus CBS 101889]
MALADLLVPRDLSISPDGTKVAYTLQAFSKSGEHATASIWIAKVGEENSSRQFTSGLFNDEQPQWSPTGTSIAFRSDRHRPGQSSAIYVLPVDEGGEAYPLTPVNREKPIVAFEWNAAGTSIAYTSADEKTDEQVAKEKARDDPTVWGEDKEDHGESLRLRIAHVSTRHTTTLVAGHRHVHDFTWSPDARQICFIAHRGPDINSPGFYGAEIWIASISGLESSSTTTTTKRVAEFPGPISQIAWANCGVYFIAGHVPTHCLTSLSLYELDLDQGSYAERTDGDAEHCCIAIRKNSQSRLSYRAQRYLADEFYSIDDADGTRTKVYSEECEMTSFDILQTPDNSVILAITKGDGSHPEEVFSVSAWAGTVQLSAHNSALAALQIAQSWAIATQAADGYYLDGMIYVPSTYSPKDGPLPTILMPHGGPYWRITTGFAVCHCLEAPLLVSMGYAVLCPNYRGGSSRGETHAAYARGGAGTVDYTDCIDILRSGISKGWVDPGRVIIGGWSQGGFLSYFAVTREDFRFRGAICGAGISEWDSMAMTSDAYWMQGEVAGGAPWDVNDDDDAVAATTATPAADSTSAARKWITDTHGRRGSALWHMRNVTTPVLILHGENDVRVPVSQAIAFYRACVRNNVPVRMVTYPREGHFILERKHLLHMWDQIRKFCSRHLQ